MLIILSAIMIDEGDHYYQKVTSIERSRAVERSENPEGGQRFVSLKNLLLFFMTLVANLQLLTNLIGSWSQG